MYLEFVDGTQLECIRILGGPRSINGIVRDCLTIEVDPRIISREELVAHFYDTSNLVYLYTRELPGTLSPRREIGEGYMHAVDVRTENRKDTHEPGIMVPESYTNFHILNIAQLTYEEYQLWKAGEYTPPSFMDISD